MNYTFVHLPGTMLDVNDICFLHMYSIFIKYYLSKKATISLSIKGKKISKIVNNIEHTLG